MKYKCYAEGTAHLSNSFLGDEPGDLLGHLQTTGTDISEVNIVESQQSGQRVHCSAVFQIPHQSDLDNNTGNRGLINTYTVKPPNNESIGTSNFFPIIWRFSLLRGTNLLKSMQMVHWKNFIMRGFSLLGEFIIGGFTVSCGGDSYRESVDCSNFLSNGEDVQQSLSWVLPNTISCVDDGAVGHLTGSLEQRERKYY